MIFGKTQKQEKTETMSVEIQTHSIYTVTNRCKYKDSPHIHSTLKAAVMEEKDGGNAVVS